MRFRLSCLVAMFIALLLLPTLGVAQQSASPSSGTSPSQDQSGTSQEEQTVAPVMSGAYPVMSKAAEARARQIFEMFDRAQTSAFWATLSPGLKKHYGSDAKLAVANKKLSEHLGKEDKVLGESIVPYVMAPDTVYARRSEFSNVRVPVITTITLNQRGEVDLFTIGPEPTVSEGRYAGYTDVTKLHLPFKGEWLVYQGGRTPFDNIYAGSDDLRFAMDFVYPKDGRIFSGPGGIRSKNTDYYCFGQPILAPADGTVIKAEAGYDDNDPGKATGDSPDGNIVVIAHGNGEFSQMNHLKQNSLKVKVNDTVKQGDILGECGNSGASPIPHLHYQFQRSPGALLPAQFNDYIADGTPVANGEVKKGQMVKNASTPAQAATPPPASNATAKPVSK
jgi:murein DD-endopeptidase MepM/ murein hydrolase activator NlpD